MRVAAFEVHQKVSDYPHFTENITNFNSVFTNCSCFLIIFVHFLYKTKLSWSIVSLVFNPNEYSSRKSCRWLLHAVVNIYIPRVK